jgi:hypothetical protein
LSRKRVDTLFSLVLLGIIVWMTWEAQKWDARARLFPVAIGIPAAVIALLQVGFALRALRADAVAAAPAPDTAPRESSGSDVVIAEAVEHAFGQGSTMAEETNLAPAVVRRRTLEMVGWILGITASIVLLGFELGAGVMSLVFLRLRGHESWRVALCIALTTYFFFYVVFDRVLNIPLPNGALADALGLNALDHYVMDPIADFVLHR